VRKSRLARRLATMLPVLRLAEALEPRASFASPLAPAPVLSSSSRIWAGCPHDLVAATGLNGGSLVTPVTQRSRQQACDLLPVHGQAVDVFDNQRHEPPLRLGEVAWASSSISSSSAGASLSQMRRAQMRGYP
jgi:hypothetical protein